LLSGWSIVNLSSAAPNKTSAAVEPTLLSNNSETVGHFHVDPDLFLTTTNRFVSIEIGRDQRTSNFVGHGESTILFIHNFIN
jgi:hypothetical protein